MIIDPLISVLIPAYNEAALIAATIDSIHRSFTGVSHAAYEIIVCDNNSTDATAEIAKHSGARVVFEPHNQIARARNTAAREAAGEWFIFLDADTTLSAPLLRATIAVIKTGRVAAGGALVRLDAETLPPSARIILRSWNRISVLCKLAAGSYVFCRRDAWAETGGFPEDVYVTEEIWFSRKLKAWCRAHKLEFRIITATPVVTSARKLHWYTPAQIIRQMFALMWPAAIKNRDRCEQWYTRPVGHELKKD